MRYYPVNLDIRGRRCLVVGGGRVGARKVDTLIQCGAVVTVVSPEVSPALEQLAAEKAFILKQRPYQSSDVEGMFLVIGATDDETLNRQINADAEHRNLLCNIADRPEICNFILPAIVRRGDFVMAISTAGKSPAFAKHIRKRLEAQFGPEYGLLLDLMGAIRTKLLADAHEPEVHKPLFEQLIAADLLSLVKDRKTARIDHLLERVLGPGYRYDQLMPSNQQPRE
ncbi:MAG: bifunctional precorrin-2 dehydrogenase/sirohydrochlorin ferrochelatase [Desulfosarcina sp.]|nr:bifunctional precorrin-2 dehydrogenase/sirohydrochlorin ferrochelatase [Desulfosarcina sp.]MBC2743681.1 bifunctional precorrin-2 dehydrogenase/sirohydrochlorin ferrochelatase [Desulfosarcina sp.]MBC2766590.1 bifunctional precorrin-2 dehydrogenase/sirohydrochlorin ferrochelatase [Desulfosarcina sp.]